MGVTQSVFVGTLGLGAIVVPALIDAIGDRWTLVAVGLPVAAAAALAFPRFRRLDDETALEPAHVALLRAVPIFTPLPVAIVDQLARDATTVAQPAGTRIVTQGEPGDAFYVIVDGEVDVAADGRPLQTLHTGDGFGEIALLRDVRRTATVTATTPVELLAITRDEFLAAVTGYPESAAAAHAIAAARLGTFRQDIASV
jgi:hypothetical protein